MKIMQEAGIIIPHGGVASTPEQAYEIASTLGKLYCWFSGSRCLIFRSLPSSFDSLSKLKNPVNRFRLNFLTSLCMRFNVGTPLSCH